MFWLGISEADWREEDRVVGFCLFVCFVFSSQQHHFEAQIIYKTHTWRIELKQCLTTCFPVLWHEQGYCDLKTTRMSSLEPIYSACEFQNLNHFQKNMTPFHGSGKGVSTKASFDVCWKCRLENIRSVARCRQDANLFHSNLFFFLFINFAFTRGRGSFVTLLTVHWWAALIVLFLFLQQLRFKGPLGNNLSGEKCWLFGEDLVHCG